MNIQVLLEKYFDVAFAAPNGVKKLRELILSLAMQGKLVAQDPHDVPASELLKEIEAEKKRLVKEGKIKQSKPLPEIKPDEIPYDLPKSWEWVKLGSISTKLTDGSHNPPKDSGIGYPMLSSQNVNFGKIDFSNPSRYVSDEDFLSENKRTKIAPNDVLLTIVASLGRPAVVPENAPKFVLQRSVAVISTPINSDYLCKHLGSPICINYYLNHGKGTAQKGIYLGKLGEMLIALPPLAEQRRIVAKIDELMARCDELEKLRGNLNQKQITVHNAALNRLLTAKDQSDFNTAWQFITQNFGDLYSVKENVAELRKAILQLAVMGKLVPQDPIDRPASELLKKIEKEKERLVKEGKIKEPKTLSKITIEEEPYDLPKGWQWVNLQDLFAVVTDGDHQAPPKSDDGIPFLVIGNLNTGKVTLEGCRFVPHDYFESLDWGRKPSANDILYTVTGSYGIPIFIDSNLEFCVQRHVAILKSVKSSPVEYLTHLLKSKYALQYAISVATGIAQKTVPLSGLRKMPIAVPPINEQHRIVIKINRLMALCDNLEKQIDETNSKKTNLLNTVMTKF